MEFKRRLFSFGTIFVIFCIVINLPITEGLNASACYGTNPACDFYDLICPENQIIKLDQLYAGRKTDDICLSANHCTNKELCCSRSNDEEILEPLTEENIYKTYNNCSGKQECLKVQAPWQLMRSGGVTSNFVEMNYDCVDADLPMDFCSASRVKRTGSIIELKFDGKLASETYNPADGKRNCSCQLTSSSSNLIQLSAIDVRMHSYHKDENQTHECSSATFRSVAWVQTCAETQTHYRTNFVYDSTNFVNTPSDISLQNLFTNGVRDAPAMVWVALEEPFGLDFSLECQEVNETATTTSTSTTSTTTTTTTSTTSTTTTTTTPTTTTTTTTTPTTTTTTTTTPKPTTKPSTTTSTSTTTTPRPVTTPSTTTPRPITSTSTTTTTTSTTPSTTSTTPKTTTTTSTTTTTTTPRPITSTSSTSLTTPTTIATTPRPVTTPSTMSTTQSTSPIQTSRTSTRTTTQRPVTTVSTSTTPTTTSTTRITTRRTTTTPAPGQTPQGFVSRVLGDGVDDETQRTQVLLAIIIPIVVFVILLIAFVIWIYWKRTSIYRPNTVKEQPVIEDPGRRPQFLYFTNDSLQL